ncbi:MAG: hypothetical protein ACI4U9_01380 [Clostridia bacterium]
MKFILVIAVILGLLFGFSVGANFFAAALIAGLVAGFIGCIGEAIKELSKFHIVSALIQLGGAAIFGWLLSICF